ncbi:hypothetical protein P152DRAFT_257482 [Eremomyces bilateralis CBS 781.70]|uniref:Uncharacterized protein n=1 Tax=Eremomyces bilateralis CBS 781.70 TaxID=1392243 RepID=A0A6G1FQH6_9PEZI|nr:uncharacterized protein P152DRAFT_257482 [Eremomyces bilateralis CBS 781.70]KAF1808047.1 hypothetical protein P152DRAFT_257482 [Eremomyces bilateralis CBS 781.70]
MPCIWPTHADHIQITFIGCPLASAQETWHFTIPVTASFARIDQDYLRALFQYGVKPQRSHCVFIDQTTGRRRRCGFDHPEGYGKVVQRECEVRFDIYVPVNMARYKFFVLCACGPHSHHPPFPNRVSEDVRQLIRNALKEEDVLTLTPLRFIQSPTFKSLMQAYGQDMSEAIARAVAVRDRISMLIRKQRLLEHPDGTSLAGVAREADIDRTRPNEQQWIRKIVFIDEAGEASTCGSHYIVICMTYAGAKQFHKSNMFEMDTAFKGVHGGHNVFSIAGWDSEVRRKLTIYTAYFVTDNIMLVRLLLGFYHHNNDPAMADSFLSPVRYVRYCWERSNPLVAYPSRLWNPDIYRRYGQGLGVRSRPVLA